MQTLTSDLIDLAGSKVDGDDVIIVSGGQGQKVAMAGGGEESHITDAG